MFNEVEQRKDRSMNVSVTPLLEEFVHALVGTGKYHSGVISE